MKEKCLSEKEFETKLGRLLERVLDPIGGQVSTFEDRGVLTLNRGLVVRLPSGQEFHLTIVESTQC